MKFLTITLSLYILGLAILPCSDAETFTESEKQDIAQMEHNSQQENPEDDCAPFCSCQCCQSQLTIIDFPVFESFNPEFRYNPVFYRNNLGREFPSSLFQPPRA